MKLYEFYYCCYEEYDNVLVFADSFFEAYEIFRKEGHSPEVYDRCNVYKIEKGVAEEILTLYYVHEEKKWVTAETYYKKYSKIKPIPEEKLKKWEEVCKKIAGEFLEGIQIAKRVRRGIERLAELHKQIEKVRKKWWREIEDER